MRIAVAGAGYVGLSLAVLLAQHNDVIAVDVVADKVNRINAGMSPSATRRLRTIFPTGSSRLRRR